MGERIAERGVVYGRSIDRIDILQISLKGERRAWSVEPRSERRGRYGRLGRLHELARGSRMA